MNSSGTNVQVAVLGPSLPARPTPAARAGVVGEFLRYLLASLLALAADMAVFSGGIRMLALPWAVSAPLGFVVGAACAYWLSVRVVFHRRSFAQSPRTEFFSFVLIGVFGLGMTQLVLWVAIELLSLNPELSKLGSAGLTFLSNFVLRKHLLFAPRLRSSV